MKYQVKDINLAAEGRKKIEWAGQHMPVLKILKQRWQKSKPLRGVKLAACLHVTSETANLMILLKAAGAEVRLAASNPLSTQDEVAAALVKYFSIPVFAVLGAKRGDYYKHLSATITEETNMTMDDGADLINLLHTKKRRFLSNIIGGTEETTTGVIRLKAMAAAGRLAYPVIAVNDAYTKHLFDNRYGTGQSTIDGIMRATNILLAGKVVVVAGYGWCGRGVAMRARGLGAEVIVTEVDPIRALEARMDGFSVMTMTDACLRGDIFVTATGDINVIDKKHFALMKSGAVLANAGHFDVEINVKALARLAKSRREIRREVTEYDLGGKKIYLLAAGRLVNLSVAEGHPAQVMDMSFAGQFLALKYLWQNASMLDQQVHLLPFELDQEIAKLKLKAMGIKIDKLSKEQRKYLASWQIGT